MLSDGATHEAVHLLCRMLVFDPVSPHTLSLRIYVCFVFFTQSLCFHLQTKRISGSDALSHPYLDEGRLRYHTCMCQCCYSVPSGRVYTRDFEPVAERPFSHSYENSMLSVWQGKGTPHTHFLLQLNTLPAPTEHTYARPGVRLRFSLLLCTTPETFLQFQTRISFHTLLSLIQYQQNTMLRLPVYNCTRLFHPGKKPYAYTGGLMPPPPVSNIYIITQCPKLPSK